MENIFSKILNEFPINNPDLNYNPDIRDNFIKNHLLNLPNNSKVLDVSSGTKPYEKYLKHCNYTSHEFEGNKDIIDEFRIEKKENKKHDIYSPIDDIPLPDNNFDFILCTEVFEHIPEPINAMKEIVRLCKPNGKILITTPFTSGIHQEPYHYYSGFSPYFYKYLEEKYNLNIIDFKNQGDMFLLCNQESNRVFSNIHPIINNNYEYINIYNWIRNFICRYTIHMSKLVEDNNNNSPKKMLDCSNHNRFTIGYCVLYEKKI